MKGVSNVKFFGRRVAPGCRCCVGSFLERGDFPMVDVRTARYRFSRSYIIDTWYTTYARTPAIRNSCEFERFIERLPHLALNFQPEINAGRVCSILHSTLYYC